MAKRYVVTGHLAAFDTFTQDGLRRITFYRGQPVPQDATPAAIEHNLSVNLIAEVPGNKEPGVDSAGAAIAGTERLSDPESEPGEPFAEANALQAETPVVPGAQASREDSELADKRAAAKAKLPEDGSAPDGRASKDVLVEYLVTKGYSYDELVKQDAGELKALAKQQA